MVDDLNKFDILTEKLIKTGKSHNLLRIPMFIAIMALVVAEGIYEISRKVYRFLFKKRFLSKALSLAVAWFMFAPFYQPAVIFAMENTPAQSETTEETAVPTETTTSSVPNSESEETNPSDSENTETTVSSSNPENSESSSSSSNSDNTDTTPVSSDSSAETNVPEGTPSETEDTSVTPSETELPEETEILPELLAEEPAVETVHISDADDLFAFFNDTSSKDKNVVLTADINCSGMGTLPVMSSYNGVFDGKGFVIRNLTLGSTPRDPEADRVSAMFINFGGTMKNVGFVNVNSTNTMGSANAAVVALRATSGASISNCFIINSTITGRTKERTGYFVAGNFTTTSCYVGGTMTHGNGLSNTNGVKRITSPAGCTTEVLTALNNASNGLAWYKDTAPDYSNYGYFSMKPSTPVEFYKSTTQKFTGNELSFGGGKANADTYAVIEGNVIYAPDNDPTVPRKTFLGWSLDPYSETPMDLATYTVDENDFEDGVLKIYAVWDFNPVYKITFIDKNGNEIDLDTNPDDDVTKFVTDEINSGKAFTDFFNEGDIPEESEADAGYEFDGWYRVDTDEKWDFATSTVAKSEYSGDETEMVIELEERYIPIEYGITLNTNGGEVTGENPIIYTIEDEDITLPIPTKTGYTFTGWKVTASDFTDIVPVGDDIVTIIPNNALSNITVTAQWDAITYIVKYDINAATYIADDNVETEDSEHIYDVSSALSENKFKRDYYTFEGWATSSDGEKIYNDKAQVLNLTDINNGEVTLYAVWKPIEYTITYENSANGAYPTINSEEMRYTTIVNNNQTTYTIENRTINLTEVTCTGYTFTNWKYNGGTVMNNNISLPDNPLPESITITGEWAPTPYTVNYDTNDGFWHGGFDLTDFTSYDITKSLTLPTRDNIYRDYYKFGGWEISGDCSKNGTTVYSLPAGTYGNATATAVWDPINYTLRVELSGGELPDGVNIPSTYNNTTVMTLPIPSKTGYTFDGWTAVVDSGYADNGNFHVDDYTTKIENNFGNVTLTANFTINQYTISFDTDGGSEVPSITDDYGQAVEAPADPTKEGHDFRGWYSDSDFNTEYEFTTIPAESITVYAKWEIQKFDVSFDTDGGSAIETQVIEYGSTATRPQNNPTKDSDANGNYRFLGWFADSECTETFDFTTPIKETTTVYAKWLSYEEEPVLYNVSYKTSADSEDTLSIGTFAEGEQMILPSVPDDAVNHKVFVGFTLEGDTAETPVVYNSGDVFTVGAEDIIFIVVWEAETHSVTFVDDDGVTEIEVQNIEYNKTATEPSYQKRGFILKGWFTTDGTAFTFDTPITEDIVLKAEWEEITIPETPSRPGSSGSSGVKYDKTIRITEVPDGITAPAELFKATADMDDFNTSVDVRISNASETAEDELRRLLKIHADIPDEDIFIFDISLYERGTDRKIKLPANTMVSLSIPVCDKFTSELEKVRVISVHNGKLVIYPDPYMSSSGKHLIVNFSSDKFSTFAFVLDREDEIMDLSASAPSAMAAEMILYAPPAIIPAISGVIVNGRTKLRISRKKKVYKVLRKFH